MTNPLAPWGARVAVALTRRRVTLGFVFGAVVLWLAQPTWELLMRGAVFAMRSAKRSACGPRGISRRAAR